MMKRFICLAGVCLLLSVSSPSFAEITVGYVNMQVAITKSEKGKAARVKLDELVEEKRAHINKLGDEIESIQDAVEKQGHLYTEEARRQKMAEIEIKQREYTRLVSRFEEDLKWAEQDLIEQLTRELRPLVEQVGKKNNFSLVFEYSPNRWLYVDSALDITDKVIEAFNKKN